MHRTALIVMLGLALAGCEDLFSSSDPEPLDGIDRSPAGITTGKPIVDTDYRFRLDPPGAGWRLMGETEIRNMAPDAVAGAVHGQGMFGVVIVEPAPGVPAEELAQLVVENMALENKQVGDFEPLTFAGKPATRVTITGTTQGLTFRYVNHVFEHQGFFYQVMAGGMSAKVDARGRALAPFFSAFSLTEGKVQARKAQREVIDTTGVGWRVKDGVFESAAYGLRVEPRGDWRLAVGAELDQMNPNAEVGLVCEQAYLILLMERASGVDRKRFAKKLRQDMLRNISAKPSGKPARVTIGGREVRLHRMRTATKPVFEYLHGVMFVGDNAVQVLYWSLAGLKEKASGLMPDALASIAFMTHQQASALAGELAGRPDPQNRVGPGYSLRRGTYRSFAHGLTWKKPPAEAGSRVGFWRISVGEQARAFNPDSSLVIEDPVAGVFGMLIVEPAGGFDGPGYHDLVTRRAFAKPPTPETVKLGPVSGLSSTGRKDEDGLKLTYRLVTAIHSGQAIQFAFWGVPDAMREHGALVAAALAGLDLTAAPKPSQQTGGRTSDWRFGFSYQPPGTGWQRKELTPPEMREAGTVLDFSRGAEHVLLLSVCALDAGQDREWFLRFIQELIQSRMAELPLGPPGRDKLELAGATWDRLRWRGSFKADAYLTMRDRTFYGLLTMTDRPRAAPPEGVATGFAFLD